MVAAAAGVMVAATMVAAPGAQAVDGVTVRHLPAKVKIVDDGYACIEFEPKVSGPNYDTYSVDVMSVTARGSRYSESYCGPKGKTRKLMKRKSGLAFTVAYTYDYRATLQGQRRSYSVWYSSGAPGLSEGWQYLNDQGQPSTSSGNPTSDDVAADWPGYRIDYGPWEPWAYTATREAVESFTTNVRLVKE